MLSIKTESIPPKLEEALFMTAMSIGKPKFRLTQWVSFAGGEGVVQSHISESGRWTYLIEMTLGPEPNFGRVGAETTVVFDEADLRAA